ncbi:MAG: polysaccharide lyase 8 family protein [Clostridium baratii]
MNRKRIKKIILTGVTLACVTNIFGTVSTSYAFADNKSLGSIEEKTSKSSNVLLNENFDESFKESDNTYKTWWRDEIRPLNWQLRKWAGAQATVNNTPYGEVIEDSATTGGKYVKISCNNTVGFFQPDKYININPNTDYNISIKLKTTDISSNEPLYIRAEYYDSSNKVVERKDIKTIYGNNNWTEYKLKTSTSSSNATKMKIIFVFGRVSSNSVGAKGSLEIDNIKIDTLSSNLERVDFENKEVNLGVGVPFRPTATRYPVTSKEEYTLHSDDESIAKVENGIIRGVKIGITTIKAISDSQKEVGSFKVNVKQLSDKDFDKALDGIFETMIPNSIIDLNDDKTVEVINELVKNGRVYWNTMIKGENKKGLWSDTTSTTNSSHITTQFNRLYDMTVAYKIKGSDLYGNKKLLKDIKSGLEWLIQNRYDGNKFYNNWWDFEIGSPQKLNSILIMLRDEFTDLEILNYTNIIYSYVKDPTKHTQGKYPSIGANRADMCKVVIYSGLLSKNEDRINYGVENLDLLFKYVDDIIAEEGKKTDGYYKDGSWVEHGSIPYAGSYGAVFIGGIGEIAHVLNDTPWSIKKEKLNNIYEVILNSFEPLMYKGVMMDMVSGRSISRENEKDYGHGFGIMRRILAFYIETAPKEYSDRYKSMIKEWISSNKARDFINTSNNIQFIAQAKALMNDENVKPRGELIGNYIFPNMDRVVHRRKGFTFGVSMYSSRISNYESLNGENLKGYHTSDGMTYLYNGDIEQYSKDYWPTVNSKRLPGTTVDTKDIFKNVAGTNYGPGETATSNRDWVGGVSLGDYGVAGMYLDNKRINPNKDLGMDLEAKKSYFMFGDEIVALGAGINSTKDSGVETIIENRLIDKDTDSIFINGKNLTSEINKETKVKNISWAYLKGKNNESSIGYYFPKSDEFNILRETRSGTWKDINNGQSSEIKSNTFFTMWKDHGKNPENDTYEYVLLPNKSMKEVEKYSKKSNIKIISNNENVQAVKDEKKGLLGLNVWNDDEVSIDNGKVKIKGKSSIIIRKTNGSKVEIGISDPTMNNKGKFRIELSGKLHKVLEKDERLNVIKNGDKVIIEMDAKDSNGQTSTLKLKITNKK